MSGTLGQRFDAAIRDYLDTHGLDPATTSVRLQRTPDGYIAVGHEAIPAQSTTIGCCCGVPGCDGGVAERVAAIEAALGAGELTTYTGVIALPEVRP